MIRFNHNELKDRLYPQGKCLLNKVILALPKILPELLHTNECWVAGGFIRRWYYTLPQTSDIDLFFGNDKAYNSMCEELNKITLEPPVISKFNKSFKIKIGDTPSPGQEDIGKPWILNIQAINHNYYTSMEALMDSFDFTLCQFAYNGVDICITENGLIDSQRKRLVPHKITYGVSSLRRIIKYTSQGYYMCGGSASNFLNQITPLKLLPKRTPYPKCVTSSIVRQNEYLLDLCELSGSTEGTELESLRNAYEQNLGNLKYEEAEYELIYN